MIPYNTDAPLYHFPLATLALIVLNAVLLVTTPAEMIQPPSETKFSILDLATVVEVEDPLQSTAAPFRLSLDYGQGLKPWQWFTAMFMHNGVIHLVLNMISLWAFGLVVEGKVGSLVFLLLYVGIGVTQAAVAQTLLSFGNAGGSLGANAAILGLLGIAIVWAPRNDFDIFWSFGLRGGTVEVPILAYGFIALGFEFLGVAFGPLAVASSILHLLGLVLGIGFGFLWLKRRWVDCEGWDLVSVYHGVEGKYAKDHEASAAVEQEARELIRSSLGARPETPIPIAPRGSAKPNHTSPAPSSPAKKRLGNRKSDCGEATSAKKAGSTNANRTSPPAPPKTSSARGSNSAKQPASLNIEDGVQQDIDNLISAGNYATALKLIDKLRQSGISIEMTQPQLGKVIRDLLAAHNFATAIPFLTEHIERFTEARSSLQLNLAKILLHMERPHRAATVLRSIPRETLDENSKVTWGKLATHAKQQIDSGVIELSD